MKIQGIALAGAITNFLTYIFMRILFSMQDDLAKANHWPDSRSFDLKGLCDYFMLGVPMILINSLDYWGWEAMTLTSGLIGVKEQASQVMLINMAMMAYMSAYGM